MAPKKQETAESTRTIAITAADGHTGFTVAELLLTDGEFSGQFKSIIALTHGNTEREKELEKMGATVITVEEAGAKALKEAMESVDTVLLIPPATKNKFDLVRKYLHAAKAAKTVQNVVLLSSVGCDYAERDKQPRMREFIDLETLTMAPKSDPSTGDTAHSLVIIRAGFYAENLLLYSKQSQGEGKLPLPIDKNHKFAPVALGDVALLAAKILTSTGPQGLADNVRGQLFVLTGPMMVAGPELAEAASQALSTKLVFESVSETQAKKILSSSQGEEVDEAEKEYLLEYYALVREGKTNYVATAGFEALTGQPPQQMTDFFASYETVFKPKKRKVSKK